MAELELDTEKLDNAALAILSLTLHGGNRVWRGLDWAITDRLHAKGLIADPVGHLEKPPHPSGFMELELELTRFGGHL